MHEKRLAGRYLKELFAAMAAYAILLVVSLSLLGRFELPQFGRVLLALLPAIPVVFVVLAIGRLLQGSDEMQQRVHLQAAALAAALTGIVTFSYGFLELVGFPNMPTFLVFPLLVVFWGLGQFIFRQGYGE